MPCRDLIASVERVAPCSSAELNSPLWKILLIKDMTIRRVGRYIGLLEPKVRRAMFNWTRAKVDGTQNHVRYSQGRTLVRAGSLDALAGLVLMWEVYRHEGRDEDMRTLADLIYKCMMIAGEAFKARGLAAEFFAVFYAKVFEKTVWENGRFVLSAEIFAQSVGMLNDTLFTVEDEGPLQSKEDIRRVKQGLMYGQKGFDCRFGFGVLVFPDWKVGPPTRPQYEKSMLKLLQWMWGWVHLDNQTHGRFPCDDLWKRLDAIIGKHEFLDLRNKALLV